MATTESEANIKSGKQALLALIPPLAGALAAYLLRLAGAPEFGQVAGAAATTLVSGVPLYQRAVNSDKNRAESRAQESDDTAANRPAPVKAGPSTITLSVILGATAFWLIDIILAQATFTILLAVPSTYEMYRDETTLYLHATAISGTLAVAATFPIAVWLAHRLGAASKPAMAATAVLFTVMLIAFNVALKTWSQMPIIAAEILVPLAMGFVTWGVTSLACRYARRTQYRYEAMRTASPVKGSPPSP